MAGYDELKIQVGFELDENVGSKLEKELAALSKARDFKISATVDINKDQVAQLSKLENTISKFNDIGAADVNRIKQISEAFSSITIDDAVVKNIDKIQKSLESFSKLSVDLQKRLANVSLFEGAESELKGVTMNMKQFDEQVEKTLANIKKGVKGSSESLTGYVNAQKGTVEVLVERLNDVYKVTKNIDASGNVIGKVTGNVDGYVKSITSSMKSNYDKLLRYQSQYYKAVSEQDSDMVKALDSVMDYYKYQQKLLEQALDNNGLSEYADNTVKELKQVYEMTKRIEDIKSLNLLEQKEVKEDKKILNDFIKDYDNVIKQLKKYEPELLGADSKKNKKEREFLENKVAKLRDTKEQLESMIPSFKDWEKALAEFEKKDNELQDRIKQKQAKLKDKEVEESSKKAVKDENDLYKDTINKYKSLTKEIESLSKKQLDAFYKGDTTTFNKLESDIKGLYDKRDALNETIKKLKDYGKAQKEIDEINKSTSNEIDRKIANIQDNINKKTQEEIAKLQKKQEKSDKEELYKNLANYKKVSEELTSATNDFSKAVENGSQNTIDFHKKEIEALEEKKATYLDLLKAHKNYQKVEDDVKNIDSESAKQIAKQEAILKDYREKNDTKNEKDLYKDTIKQYKSLTKEIEDLIKKQLDAFNNGNQITFSNLESDIKALREKRDALKETVQGLKEYEKAQAEINEIDKSSSDELKRKISSIQDSINKKTQDEIAKLQKDQEKSDKEDLNKYLDGYKKTSKELANATNEFYKAIENGSQNTIDLYDKETEALAEKQKKYLDLLKANKYYNKVEDEIREIDSESAKQIAKQEAIIKDLREKNAIKDREDTIKMYSKLFDQLELSRVEDRNSEPIRQRQELEKYVKDYEVLVDKIIALKNKQATADKNENKETSSRYGLEILELEESKRSLLELIKTHKDYAEVKDKMIAIQKDIANKNRLLEATIKDDQTKKETSSNEKREKEKYSYLLDEYEKTVNKINSLAKEQRRALDSGNQPLFNQVTEDIKALKLKEEALKKDIATLKDYEKANERITKITKENREELNRVDAKREGESENKRRIEVEKLSDAYEKLGKAIQENLSKANNLKDSSLLKDTNIDQVYNDLLKMSKIDFSNLGKADVDNLNNKLEKLVKTLKEYESLKVDNKKFELNDLKVDKLESEFKSLESQIRETFGNSYADTLISDLKELRQVASKSGDEFEIMSKKWSNSMDDLKREMKSLKGDMGSSGGFFSDFYEELFTFTAGELLAEGIQNVGRAMTDIVMEYDHAMTNLKKVANPEDIMSASQLDAIEQKAVSIAKNVGMASQDVISAIADTIQMSGRSMEESIVIAEQTMMLANVAEMTQESASQAVVSMMAAFNLDPLKEVPIVVDGVTKSTTELTNAMDMVNYVG